MRYTLARGMSEAVERPDVVLVGNGRRLVYRRGGSTPARELNQKDIKFTEVGHRSLLSSFHQGEKKPKKAASAASRTTGNIPTAARSRGRT